MCKRVVVTMGRKVKEPSMSMILYEAHFPCCVSFFWVFLSGACEKISLVPMNS